MTRFIRHAAILGSALLIAGWTNHIAPAQQTAPPPAATATSEQPQPGVEVLARGPVHEAFAQPYAADPAPTPVVPKAPPAPVPELPPNNKPDGANVEWIPGYWSWDGDRADFIWVSGTW